MKVFFLVALLLAIVFAEEKKTAADLLANAPPGVGCKLAAADASKDVLALEKKVGAFFKKLFAPYHPKAQVKQTRAAVKPAIPAKPLNKPAVLPGKVPAKTTAAPTTAAAV